MSSHPPSDDMSVIDNLKERLRKLEQSNQHYNNLRVQQELLQEQRRQREQLEITCEELQNQVRELQDALNVEKSQRKQQIRTLMQKQQQQHPQQVREDVNERKAAAAINQDLEYAVVPTTTATDDTTTKSKKDEKEEIEGNHVSGGTVCKIILMVGFAVLVVMVGLVAASYGIGKATAPATTTRNNNVNDRKDQNNTITTSFPPTSSPSIRATPIITTATPVSPTISPTVRTSSPTFQTSSSIPTFTPTAVLPQDEGNDNDNNNDDGPISSFTCGTASLQQRDYRGQVNVTANGKTCQHWSPFYDFVRTAYPNAGLDENYCRNPFGFQTTWCYVLGIIEPCNVPNC